MAAHEVLATRGAGEKELNVVASQLAAAAEATAALGGVEAVLDTIEIVKSRWAEPPPDD